jgi:hypothetical protein
VKLVPGWGSGKKNTLVIHERFNGVRRDAGQDDGGMVRQITGAWSITHAI